VEKTIKTSLVAGILLISVSTASNAALLLRMNGEMIYDDVLNITWLANANLANSNTFGITGIDSNGAIDTGAPGCDWSRDGTDCGFSSDTSTSEAANLYYDTFELAPARDIDGNLQTDNVGVTAENTLPFYNFRRFDYWLGLDYAIIGSDGGDHAWHIDMHSGRQLSDNKLDYKNVLAVIEGDISAVPVPAAVWLFGSGLLGLVAVSRRKSGEAKA